MKALSARSLVVACAFGLFVLSAWPMLTLARLPYQDLPNHYAAATIVQHPDLYPEFVFNGFAKTNSILLAWLLVVGKVVGMIAAGKAFCLLTVLLMSLGLPLFLLEFGGKERVLIGSLLGWPMVHNWFVVMGMVDFSFSVALSLFGLVAMKRLYERPTLLRVLAVTSVGGLMWFAHVFPLYLFALLVLVEAIQSLRAHGLGEVFQRWKYVCLALVLPGALAATSLLPHLFAKNPPGTLLRVSHPPVWELAYNLWAEWLWTFSKLEALTLVPAVALAWILFRGLSQRPWLFSRAAVLCLLAAYALLPCDMTNWFFVNSRVIPFIWLAALVRVPSVLPPVQAWILAGAATVNSLATAVDLHRLDRETEDFTAALPFVPENARLLPMIFKDKIASENTRNLLHNWGYYVLFKHTSAPLVFANSRTFSVSYREPPPIRFNHWRIEMSLYRMGSQESICKTLDHSAIYVEDCERFYQEQWKELLVAAAPSYSHILMWGASEEALRAAEGAYHLTFQRGRCALLERN